MEKRKFDISSVGLHIFAMIFMLMDHMWATVFTNTQWLTQVGRLAFPIFAFMIVEGYTHTKNLKKYVIRLLAFALISEIPFNFMTGGRVFYYVHQNVLWTFLIGIGLMHLNELARKKGKLWLTALTAVSTVALGYILGYITFVDYNAAGILTVLLFYFFRGRKWWCMLGQLAGLYYINVELLQGLYFEVELFGHNFEIVQQGIAVLSLVFIWLYKGRQGKKSKVFQYFCYAFYPAHMLILWIIMNLVK